MKLLRPEYLPLGLNLLHQGPHAQLAGDGPRIIKQSPSQPFLFRLTGGFRDEDRDYAIGFVLVLLVRRVCCDGDIPESLSLH